MKYVLAFVPALLFASSAFAANWQIDSTASKLAFAGKQMGSTTRGEFTAYKGNIAFNPDNPTEGKIQVTVDINSIKTPSPVIAQYLLTDAWFAPAEFPEATFVTESIRADGEDFIAEGSLTLRGKTAPISLPFAFTTDGYTATVQGKTTVKRTAFGIGQGEWGATDIVADDVEVSLDMRLKVK